MSINDRLHFGLPAGLYSGTHLPTGDYVRVSEAVRAAVTGQAMVYISGERGTGKTYAVQKTLAEYAHIHVAEPLRLSRERLQMGDIETAIMRDLSDETPRRGGEARAHQVRRILGEAIRSGRRVVLLIDDAHVLHHQTLRSLKRLMELSWAGRSPLLGIILLGQQNRTQSIPEVGLRTDHVQLAGLSEDNVVSILRVLSGSRDVLTDDLISAVRTHPRARNWLDLRQLLDDALGAARVARSAQVLPIHLDGGKGAQASTVAPTKRNSGDLDKFLRSHTGTKQVVNG